MKVGLNEIKSSNYGMPEFHMEALRKAAEKIGPIGIRPVSKFARTYLAEGHPTKPFNVKNKSSNTGIAAGLITVDPLYGRPAKLNEEQQKLSSQDKALLLNMKNEKYKKLIKAACETDIYKDDENKLKFVDLKVSFDRLSELKSLDKSINISLLTDSQYHYKITWGDPSNPIEAFAKANNENSFDIFDKYNKPIQILGRKLSNGEKGITADYDLLVYCPSYATLDFTTADQTPFRTQGLLDSSVEKNIEEVISPTRKRNESDSGGNWSKQIKNAVMLVNKKISEIDPQRGELGLSAMHHNAEFNNPYADDLENSLPCLFVLPKPMDLSSIYQKSSDTQQIKNAKNASLVLIETPEEINLLRNILRDQGYYWPSHAKYAETIPPFRPEAMELIQAAKQQTQEREARKKVVSNSTEFIFQNMGTTQASLNNTETSKGYDVKNEKDVSVNREEAVIVSEEAPHIPYTPGSR